MAVSGYGAPQDHSGLSGNNVGDPHHQYSLVMVGAASARPAAGTGGLRVGTTYIATDTGAQTVFDGAAWMEPGLTETEANRDYVKLAADNILTGRNSFTPTPANSFPTEYEPAGVNLTDNPSFEVDLGSWSSQGSATITRDTTQFVHGTASLRADVTTGANLDGIIGGGTAVGEVPAGTELAASLWVRASAAKTLLLRIRWGNTGGLVSESTLTISATTTWQRFITTGVAPATTEFAGIKVLNNNTDQGAFSFWVDGVQLEKNPVATSYIDGDQGTGFAWTGTAHASTSTRAADTVLRVARDVATMNLVTNPSFVGGLTGYAKVDAATVLAIEPTEGRIGNECLRVGVTATGIEEGVQYQGLPVTVGQTYAFSAFVRSPSHPGLNFYITFRDAAGAHISLTNLSPNVTPDWQRYTVSAVAPANSVTANIVISRRETGARDIFVDGVQFEAGNATSYVDGDLGTGYAWTGTPHASTSTRAADTIIPAQVKTIPPYGLVSEGAGRNLMPNPSVEVDLDGWTSLGGGGTIERSTGRSVIGGASVLHRRAAGAVAQGVASPRVTGLRGSTTYTVSLWASHSTTGASHRFRIQWFDSAGAFISYSDSAYDSPLGPTRRSFTFMSPSNAAEARVFYSDNGTDLGAITVLLDGVQFEAGSSPSSYIDGSLGPGYTWEGTPHASPSRRTVGTRVLGIGPAYVHRPIARVSREVAQSIPNGSGTIVDFTTSPLGGQNPINAGGMFDAAQPSRITAIEGGLYQVNMRAGWQGNTTGRRAVYLNVNGTSRGAAFNPGGGSNHHSQLSDVVRLLPGDYVQMMVFQDSGAALNIEPGGVLGMITMSVAKIGD